MTEEEQVSYALECIAVGIELPESLKVSLSSMGILELILGVSDAKHKTTAEGNIS